MFAKHGAGNKADGDRPTSKDEWCTLKSVTLRMLFLLQNACTVYIYICIYNVYIYMYILLIFVLVQSLHCNLICIYAHSHIVLRINLWRTSTCCQPPLWAMYTPGEEVCFMPPSVAASTSACGQCVPKSAPTPAPVQSGYVGNQAVLPPQGTLMASVASKSVATSQTTMCHPLPSYITHLYTSYILHNTIYTYIIYMNTEYILCFASFLFNVFLRN